MSMEKLTSEVEILMKSEFQRASEKFGDNHNSAHEAYAVMLEECQETAEELEEAKKSLQRFWEITRINGITITEAFEVEMHAINTACEAIQLAVTARKATNMFEREKQIFNQTSLFDEKNICTATGGECCFCMPVCENRKESEE